MICACSIAEARRRQALADAQAAAALAKAELADARRDATSAQAGIFLWHDSIWTSNTTRVHFCSAFPFAHASALQHWSLQSMAPFPQYSLMTSNPIPLQDRARQHEQAAAALRAELRRADGDRARQAAEASAALKRAEAAAAAAQAELNDAGSARQDAEERAAVACAESARCACMCVARTCLVERKQGVFTTWRSKFAAVEGSCAGGVSASVR